MKTESLNALLVAKSLWDKAREMCSVDNDYVASSGLVVLQDALELFFIASLIELGVDERKDLDKLNFNQFIKELESAEIRIPKVGAIKALNKQRVIVKHYGQLSDLKSVKEYLAATKLCVDEILKHVFKKPIEEIWLHELMEDKGSRKHCETALSLIDKKKYFDALVEIRKALFIEIESDYSIIGWKDVPKAIPMSGLLGWMRGGRKAPYYTKNKEWIEENVKNHFEYVQLDHEKVRVDLLEWGVKTQEFWNLWRWTPPVFQGVDKEWFVKQDLSHHAQAATEDNARYCLDKAIGLILKKQNHFDLAKGMKGGEENYVEIIAVSAPTIVYKKASKNSEVQCEVAKGFSMRADSVMLGLDDNSKYIHVISVPTEDKDAPIAYGYVRAKDCKRVESE